MQKLIKNALLKLKPKLHVSLFWICSSIYMCESSGVVAPSLGPTTPSVVPMIIISVDSPYKYRGLEPILICFKAS
jgi:hypothetical protein